MREKETLPIANNREDSLGNILCMPLTIQLHRSLNMACKEKRFYLFLIFAPSYTPCTIVNSF